MAPTGTAQRKRIVILGGGFAGAYCAQKLDRLLCDEVDVILMDRNNYMIFYPLLVEAGTGGVKADHALVGLRNFVPRSTFIQANFDAIDTDTQTVSYTIVGEEQQLTMSYDHLVVAIGTKTLTPPVPGLEEYAFEMQSLAHAIGLRDRAIRLLEQANAIDDDAKRKKLLHWVIVGGGFTGIETAGEFHQYLQNASDNYPNVSRDDIKVTIVNRGDRLLKFLDPKLSAYTQRHLTERGLRVMINEEIAEIHADHAVTKNSGERLDTSTVVWCAGVQANPIAEQFGLPTKRGYILCERDLKVQGFDNVWGLGDGAVNPGPDGDAYPTTAQAALGMGVDCAKNIARSLSGEPTQPCDLTDKGTLAAFGHGDAVAQAMGLRLTGWTAWFMWRTVYLMKMPGFSRKLRIAADWTLALFTRRDYVEMGFYKLLNR
ncbi:MAG: NAD(P)/FAD-dependent oxidoreductase [Planctomycetota bacterium]